MENGRLFKYSAELEKDAKTESFFDQPLRELKTQKCFQLLKLGIGLEPKLADFCIKRTDFNPQLIQLPPLFKAQRSQKLPDRHVKQFIFK